MRGEIERQKRFIHKHSEAYNVDRDNINVFIIMCIVYLYATVERIFYSNIRFFLTLER
jgi:hypothetical protein